MTTFNEGRERFEVDWMKVVAWALAVGFALAVWSLIALALAGVL